MKMDCKHYTLTKDKAIICVLVEYLILFVYICALNFDKYHTYIVIKVEETKRKGKWDTSMSNNNTRNNLNKKEKSFLVHLYLG